MSFSIPWRRMAVVFAVAVLGYVALSYAFFEMPATQAAAEECGFLPGEFVSAGTLTYERSQAWRVSFVRKQEAFTAVSVGLAFAFLALALAVGRRGGMASAGAAAGGGLMAATALCVSCLAPALSIVGIGVAGGFLAGVPKALIALNTLVFTGWGTLYLSRRASAACPLPSQQTNSPLRSETP